MTRYILILTLTCGAAMAASDDWAHWRGPGLDGVARGDAPLSWSDTQNVKWKIDLRGKGNSSPVIWGDKIFLTTAVPGELAPELADQSLIVMCFDKRTGEKLWERTATTFTPHEGYHRQYGSFASNTPVTDGERVYAFFGSRGLYAYDLDGNLKWKKEFDIRMETRNGFGEGIAPTLYKDTLILSFDHHGDPDFIVAIDTSNGEERWRTPRQEITNWAAPLVVEHEGKAQVVVSGARAVRSYDLATGELIWQCTGLGENVIPSPVAENGIVYVMSGWREQNLLAIKLGATGDLTGTDSVLWTNQRGNPYTASPVLHDGKLYLLTDSGMLSCFDAVTGKPFYHQQRLPGAYSFKSSPVAVNGKLYLASENDDVIVVKMGEEFEVLATNKLTDQTFIATPAVADGDIFLRSTTTLFGISGD